MTDMWADSFEMATAQDGSRHIVDIWASSRFSLIQFYKMNLQQNHQFCLRVTTLSVKMSRRSSDAADHKM